MTMREAWRLLPEKWQRVVRICLPTWVGAIFFLAIVPVSDAGGGRWWTVGLGTAGLACDAVAWWRIRPLLREVQQKAEVLE